MKERRDIREDIIIGLNVFPDEFVYKKSKEQD